MRGGKEKIKYVITFVVVVVALRRARESAREAPTLRRRERKSGTEEKKKKAMGSVHRKSRKRLHRLSLSLSSSLLSVRSKRGEEGWGGEGRRGIRHRQPTCSRDADIAANGAPHKSHTHRRTDTDA
jgi:hypothetical protein